MAQMRYNRGCGHPNDAIIFVMNTDATVEVYCLPCLMKKVGLSPCETLSVQDFINKYGGKK
jgi:hypothetical protein